MSIFLLLMLVPDVGMRQNNGWAWYSRDRWLFAADPPAVQRVGRRRRSDKQEAESILPNEVH